MQIKRRWSDCPGCTGLSLSLMFANPWRQVFLRRGPYSYCRYNPCSSFYDRKNRMPLKIMTGKFCLLCENFKPGSIEIYNICSRHFFHMLNFINIFGKKNKPKKILYPKIIPDLKTVTNRSKWYLPLVA